MVLESSIIVFGALLDWGLAIVLFYIILDTLTKFIVSIFMFRKMISERPVSKHILKNERLFMVLNTLFILSAVHILICLFRPPDFLAFDLKNAKSIIEAGLKEWWILPFVVVGAVMIFKVEFIQRLEYKLIQVDGFFKRRSLEILPIAVAALGLMYLNVGSETAILIVLASVKLAVEFPLLKLEMRLMRQNLTKGF